MPIELAEKLVNAIIFANECLEANEGVDLIYYMEIYNMAEQDQESYELIKQVLNKGI